MRHLLAFMCAVPSLLSAQQAAPLRIAPVGADVRVFTKQNIVEGILRRVSRERVEVEVGASTFVNVDGADIVDMDARLPDGRVEGMAQEGMFWGFVVGAVVGAATARSPDCTDIEFDTSKPSCNPILGPSRQTANRLGGAVVVGLVGMAAGGLIGAQVKHPHLSWVRVRADSSLPRDRDTPRH